MPASDLQVAVTPPSGTLGGYTGLDTTGVTVFSSRAAGNYSASTYGVTYRALLGWTDIPGTYTLGLTYTITGP